LSRHRSHVPIYRFGKRLTVRIYLSNRY